MIDREEALNRIVSTSPLRGIETVPLSQAVGRTLARAVFAKLTLPPADMSAMDGYAVRYSDCRSGQALKLIGEAAAGKPFHGSVGELECVRVFTGSVVPSGADHVVMQEDVSAENGQVVITENQPRARNIRKAGIDFSIGDELIPTGTNLKSRHLSICAAANHGELEVVKKPRVALLSNGDELVPPGSELSEGQIIASNEYTLSALIEEWGGEVLNLGTSPDSPEVIRSKIRDAGEVDVFVPVGGASVGDYDYMKPAFFELGFEEVFSKIAIKPGKPTWLYRKGAQLVLGLPGNPASALVCAQLFLRPLILRLLNRTDRQSWITARLKSPLNANGKREAFLRGTLSFSECGEVLVEAATDQDSSLLSPFIQADVLIHREDNALAQDVGERVRCVLLT